MRSSCRRIMPWHTYTPFMQNHFWQEKPRNSTGIWVQSLSIVTPGDTPFIDLQADPLSFGRSCRLFISPSTETYIMFRFCGIWHTFMFLSRVTYRSSLLSTWKTNLWASADRPRSKDAKQVKALPDTRVSADTLSILIDRLQVLFCFFFTVKCMFSVQGSNLLKIFRFFF